MRWGNQRLVASGALFALGLVGPCLPTVVGAATPEENAFKRTLGQLRLPDKPLAELSDPQVSRWGALALGIQDKQWKHSESDHFIIHYPLTDLRDRLIREAEFYYWKIKNDLQLTADLADRKSHIFVFANEAQWRQFQANTDVLQIGGVTQENEFFSYYPNRQDKEFSGVVAHEMTHLVFNRFFAGRPPLWLNEGFAEYQSHASYAALYDLRWEKIVKDLSAVAALDFLSITRLRDYPASSIAKQAFYVKSQLAVEALIEKGGASGFVPFVNAMIANPDFMVAFDKHYGNAFKGFDDFLQEIRRKEKTLKNRH